MREHDLYSPLIRGAMHSGWLLWRVEDQDRTRAPFDIAGLAPNGTGVGIEVKVVDEYVRSLESTGLELHQYNWLVETARHHGYGLLVVATRRYPDVATVYRLKGYSPADGDLCDIHVADLSLDTKNYSKPRYYGWDNLWEKLRLEER
jgi:hypothetical protein